MDELFDICDESGQPTGETVERSVAHRDGIMHRTAHIWIIREFEGKKQVLLQKRSMIKDSFPGCLDTSSAGHIQAGDEPLDSALRELAEELGIHANHGDLKFIGTFRISFEKEFHGSLFRDEEVAFVHVYEKLIDIESLQLQKEELESVCWQDYEEVLAAVKQHDSRYCVPPGGLEMIGRYLGYNADEIYLAVNNALNEVSVDDNLSVVPDQDAITVPASGKTLYITPETEGIDYRSVLGHVLQMVSIGDVLAKIQAGTQYVVQIPAEFQELYESGEYFIMQNQKTKKMWPTLMKISENGKNQVVTPLPITEQGFVQGNPIQDLAGGYHNMLMQQQMARLTAMVEETYRAVERIEHGQMDDRIGLLVAGKNGLMLALSMPEGDERTMQINSSRQNLLVAQGQIGQTLQRRAEEFEALSKVTSIRFFRELTRSGYLAGKDREVSEMQEYYDLYLQATKLIAGSYAITGDMRTAEETFHIGEKFMRSLDFSRVKSIEYAHGKMEDMFYSNPVAFVEAERTVCLEEAKDYDYVALEVSGEKLLEVLSSGGSEEIPEESIEQ